METKKKQPRVNIYICQYNCHNITVDVDKGTTPFSIGCTRRSTKERPIARHLLGDDGTCVGIATSKFYPREGVPENVMDMVTHEFYRDIPEGGIDILDTKQVEKLYNEPLRLRPRSNREPIYYEN